MSSVVTHLHGRKCQSVTPDEETHEWHFSFFGSVVLQVAAPWRIVSNGTIALGWRDHGQKFGLDKPMDAVRVAGSLIFGTPVASTEIDGTTGDLSVIFENGQSLQVFNGSGGYEGWVLNGPGNRWVVAQGGGRVIDSESTD